jgi:hypothetical protein
MYGFVSVPLPPLNPAANILIANSFVSFPILFVALTVKVKKPSCEGMPDIVPFDDKVNPVGKLPLSNTQVMGVMPIAERVSLYA